MQRPRSEAGYFQVIGRARYSFSGKKRGQPPGQRFLYPCLIHPITDDGRSRPPGRRDIKGRDKRNGTSFDAQQTQNACSSNRWMEKRDIPFAKRSGQLVRIIASQ
jgi:hypothetical protein